MKRSRILLLLAGSVLALVLVLGCLALLPPVQTWAARSALSRQPELKATLGRVHVLPGSVSVEALQVESSGMVLTLPRLEADLSVLSAARGVVQLGRLEAKGWELRLPAAAAAQGGAGGGAVAPEAAARSVAGAFAGLLGQLQLPVDFSAEAIELEGTLLLPSPAQGGGKSLSCPVRVSAAGLGAGRKGTVSLQVSVMPPEGPVEKLVVVSEFSLSMDSPRSFDRIAAKLQGDVSGPQFPGGARLLVDASMARAQAREAYTLEISRDRRPLLKLEGSVPLAGGAVEGTWSLKCADGDLSPFALGIQLPRFELSGSGALSWSSGREGLHASGSLDASLDRLGVIDGRLAALGALRLRAGFDLLGSPGRLRIHKFDTQLTGAGGANLQVEALQAFEYEEAGGGLKVENPARQLLRVRAGSVPLSWVAPFTGALSLTGGGVSGEWTLGAHGGGFSVVTTRDLRIERLGLSQAGRPLLKGLDLGASFRADYTKEGWQVDLTALRLEQAGRTVGAVHLKVGQRKAGNHAIMLLGDASLVPAFLARQPLCEGLFSLDKGALALTFQGSLDDTHELHLTLDSDGLGSGQLVCPDLSLELRATLAPDGTVNFTAPLKVENKGKARVSDLTVEGSLGTAGTSPHLEARATGRQLFVEDLQAFAGLLAGAAPGASGVAAAPETPVPDQAAAWAGVDGSMQVTVGRCVVSASNELVGLQTKLLFSAEELRIEQLQAKGEGATSLAFDGVIRFTPGSTPYSLEARLKASGLDVSSFTSTGAGTGGDAVSPTVDAKFDINSTLGGRGATLGDLFSRSTGNFNLLSKGGKFRLLRSDITEFLQGKSALGSLFMGGITSLFSSKSEKEGEGRDTSKLDEYARMALDLADYFAEVPFDQMNVVLVREEGLDLHLQEVSVISPLVRLTGAGSVKHVPGKAFAAQPLELQLQLAARGRIAEIFGKAGLLQETKDNLGYLPLSRALHVRGSLGTPDNSEFKELLRKLALQKADAFLERLIGGGK